MHSFLCSPAIENHHQQQELQLLEALIAIAQLYQHGENALMKQIAHLNPATIGHDGSSITHLTPKKREALLK